MDKRGLRKNLYILIFMNLALILFAIVYTLYFNYTKGTEHEIKCITQEKFGIYCPGCGGSRSLNAFMHLDFYKSLFYYPAIPVAAILVLTYDVQLVITLIKKDTSYTEERKFYSFILIPIVIILTFVIRNVLLFVFKIDTLGDIIPPPP
ncbi:MAG: DUF2752 domain-containing protein [Clostridia bacterium]|nr:DUF2752 domain-containing protein [Clostridia bacterium]